MKETIVCHDYPNCDREHAGGMGGAPVHPPDGAPIRPDKFDHEWAGWTTA